MVLVPALAKVAAVLRHNVKKLLLKTKQKSVLLSENLKRKCPHLKKNLVTLWAGVEKCKTEFVN
nr:MAG TPA: hypothetical protein [Caudoviricetes sp.]